MFMKWNFGNKRGGGFSTVSRSQRNNPAAALPPTVQPKLIQMGRENKETSYETLDSFFYMNANANDANDKMSGAFYLPTVGVTNLKLCEPNEVIADQATIFFRILDAFNIPYALFAGSSIGLLRNGKTLPFVDDYDIIIFNKHLPIFSNAVHTLKKHGFKITQSVHPQTKQKTNGGCSVYSSVIHKFYNDAKDDGGDNGGGDNGDEGAREKTNIKKSHFQCDIFFSYFDNDGFLRNNASWGLYHGKNIHMKDVLPFQRRAFDGLHLPFFKNVASEVYKCYGNVEQCIVESHNLNVRAIYRSWKVAHTEFERIKQCAKENTMQMIFQHGDKGGEDGEGEGGRDSISILDNAFSKNSLDVLRDIHVNKTKTVYSYSIDFIIQHAACIKYYFPTVNIEYFSYSRDNQVILFLNYVDVIHVYNAAVYDFYNDPRIMYLKKPRIDMITVVTFGAFSCHSGDSDSKYFSILTECAKYSENICVGLLLCDCDSPESFESRANHIKQCCKFVKNVWKDDGSADFKNRCVKMSQANILVTGEEQEHVGPENNININHRISIVRARSRKNITSDNKTKSVHFLQCEV